jgi:hypothetical protein
MTQFLLQTRFSTFALYISLAAIAVLFGKGLRPDWQTRRRLLGCFRRWTRWEFWPPWLAYIPVVPYIVFLGIKRRSLTLFTAANPGIPSGGFVGESKSGILSRLARVPAWTTVTDAASVYEFMSSQRLSYPIVLKPDVGERGSGVVIARSGGDVAAYFESGVPKTIVQQYVAGMEFGVFYYRYPGQSEGQIFSITEKRFPAVVGNGSSTIAELILRDKRAICLADLYLSRLKRPADHVPVVGESVALAELGSHCRGALFLNGARLKTEALRRAIEEALRGFPGFHIGRFDIRAESMEELGRGRFAILELNGVSAEATHIYDPSVTLLEAYRVLFEQWRIAFEIGARNRRLGHNPMALREFIALVKRSDDLVPFPYRNSDGDGHASAWSIEPTSSR